MKVVRLSALGTGPLYPPGNIPGIHFCQRLSRPQGPAGRIMSMKNSSDTIGNRTRDIPCPHIKTLGLQYSKHTLRVLKIYTYYKQYLKLLRRIKLIQFSGTTVHFGIRVQGFGDVLRLLHQGKDVVAKRQRSLTNLKLFTLCILNIFILCTN